MIMLIEKGCFVDIIWPFMASLDITTHLPCIFTLSLFNTCPANSLCFGGVKGIMGLWVDKLRYKLDWSCPPCCHIKVSCIARIILMEKGYIMLLDTSLCIILVTLIIISKPLRIKQLFKPKNLIMQQCF